MSREEMHPILGGAKPMTTEPLFTIDGETYDAMGVGDGNWIVHWHKRDETVVEALIPAASAEEAVREAIARGSWA